MKIKLLFFPFSLILFLVVFISYVKPGWDTYHKEQKPELEKLTKEKQKLEKGITNINKALAQFKKIDEESKNYVYRAVPRDIETDNLLAEINKDASQSGVMILKTSAKQVRAKVDPKCRAKQKKSKEKISCLPRTATLGVSVTALGTYPMIKDFLHKLDYQNRVVVPNGFSLSAARGGSNKKEEGGNAPVEIKLISAKLSFDVYKKKFDQKIILSKALDSDVVMKKILSNGLDIKGLTLLENLVSAEPFRPVRAEGVGKENLFDETTVAGNQPVEGAGVGEDNVQTVVQ